MGGTSGTEGLDRFVCAQEYTYAGALAELRAGRKQSHWMWFIFPQLRGLGTSARAIQFGISGLQEGREYLDHPILGPRLRECAAAILTHTDRHVSDILGSPDDLKLQSSATLFGHIGTGETAFQRILDQFYDGAPDPKTLALLAQPT